MQPQAPAFIDLQASGLGPGSYPIEVGIALPEPLAGGGWEVVLWSVLMRPTPVWLARGEARDPEAERGHGISREMLVMEGQRTGEVVRQLDALVGGRAVVADTGAAEQDAGWLTELGCAAGRPAWPSSWSLLPEDAGTLIRRQAQFAGTGARLLAMQEAGPPLTHAATEGALHHAWHWCIAAGQPGGRMTIRPTGRYRRQQE
jgi:hypothetical protein